jgi:hypothetical protein
VTRIRRAAAGALLATALLPGLAGCGAGFDAQTRQVYSPSDGVRAESGELTLLNVLVVAPPDEAEATGGATASPASEDPATGVLSMTVANRGSAPDRIVELEARDVSGTQFEGPREVAPGEVLRIGSGEKSATVVLEGLKARPGGSVALRVVFERAGTVEVQAPVLGAAGAYASLTPSARPESPSPSPSATGSPAPSPTATP